MLGLGVNVQVKGLGTKGLRIRVHGLGLRIYGIGFRFYNLRLGFGRFGVFKPSGHTCYHRMGPTLRRTSCERANTIC